MSTDTLNQSSETNLSLAFCPGIVIKYKPVKVVPETLHDRQNQLLAIDIRDIANINRWLIEKRICTLREIGLDPIKLLKQLI